MNTMAWLRHAKRFETPAERDEQLLGQAEFFQNFDGPTTDDLIDRRTASISAAQALFLMNNSSATRVIAGDLSKRLREPENPGLTAILDNLYLAVLQRPANAADAISADEFLERRRLQTGEMDRVAEIREFVHLMLCGNELIYLD